ncbi:MAG: MarR family winged helix-turn-helix transcriptional regulator [Myxococcota bacterium]
MSQLTDDVIAFCRLFATFERDVVCCGTVTVAQCVLLQELRDDPRTVSSLADTLSVTPGAVTRLVDGLVDRGYVERRRDPDDRRRVAVALTASGAEEAVRLYGITEGLVQAMVDRVPQDQRESVTEAVRTLRKAMMGLEFPAITPD